MTAESSTIRRPRISRAHYRLLTVAVSSVAGLVVWIVATLAGSRLEVTSPLVGTLAISFPLVIATAIPIAFAAWGVLALLDALPGAREKSGRPSP